MKLLGYSQGVMVVGELTRYCVSYIWECENAEKAEHNRKALEEQGWKTITRPARYGNYFTMQRENAKFGEHYSITLFFADREATVLAMVGEGVAVTKQYIHGKKMLEMSQSDPWSRPKFGIDEKGPYCLVLGDPHQ